MPFNTNLTTQLQFNGEDSQLHSVNEQLMQQVRAAEEERLLRQKLEDEKADRMRWVMKQRQEEQKRREEECKVLERDQSFVKSIIN